MKSKGRINSTLSDTKDEVVNTTSSRLRQLASRVRRALDEWIATKNITPSTAGFCISEALALEWALKEHGFQDAVVVRGRFWSKGHAWVESHGKIIDITLDQFGTLPRVSVLAKHDRRFTRVYDNETFQLEMGAGSDNAEFSGSDAKGDEIPLGSVDSVAHEIFDIYHLVPKNSSQ